MRDSRKAFGLTKEARIMAESGVIYSITVILILATYTGKSNSFNVFLDAVSNPTYPTTPLLSSLLTDREPCNFQASPIIGVAVSSQPFLPSEPNVDPLFFPLVLSNCHPSGRERERSDAHLHAGYGRTHPR